jgi:hypothetical protein
MIVEKIDSGVRAQPLLRLNCFPIMHNCNNKKKKEAKLDALHSSIVMFSTKGVN